VFSNHAETRQAGRRTRSIASEEAAAKLKKSKKAVSCADTDSTPDTKDIDQFFDATAKPKTSKKKSRKS
jgi:hypothetical protein